MFSTRRNMSGESIRSTRWPRRLGAVALVGAAVIATVGLGAVPAYAATINVTPGVVNPTPGQCSLRDAITAANTDTAVNGCAAGSGADTINAAGSYVLTTVDNGLGNGLPAITSTITLNQAQISRAAAAPPMRILKVEVGASLTLNNVSVSNGLAADCLPLYPPGVQCGAGILTLTGSTLTLNNTRVTDNVIGNTSILNAGGAGLANLGTATITNSVFTGNTVSSAGARATGAAIGNQIGATMTIINSKVNNNVAVNQNPEGFAEGGGLANLGTATVTNSELIGNSTSSTTATGVARGAGLYQQATSTTLLTNVKIKNNTTSGPTALGGGVYQIDGSFTMTNGQIMSNTASGPAPQGGGIFHSGGSTTLTNVTVSSNVPDNCEPAIGACT